MLGKLIISSIGQADDAALISNDIQKVFYLLELTKIFCSKYQVELCAEKTKLQVFSTKKMAHSVAISKATSAIEIGGERIPFSTSAEHVGMLRSISGNEPAILERFKAHGKALSGVLHTGIAKGHRGNPVSSLHIDKLYAIPVLMSGLAPLVLSAPEITMIDQHHKETLRCLLRLHQNTPRSVIYFLAGCLPGSALLHLRQLSIFGMITRLPGNILHQHATSFFSFSTLSQKSWFHQIRKWCLLYDLPHPQILLSAPLTKETFKSIVRKKVISYWENLLRCEAAPKPSLLSFNPSFMSLVSTHPIFTTAGSSPPKVAMASVQAVMLSGRYRTEALCSHWSKNKRGVCLLSEACSDTEDDINHILTICPALEETRNNLTRYTENYVRKLPSNFQALLQLCSSSNQSFCDFLLDASSQPNVISAVQLHGPLFLQHTFCVTRTWIFVIHRERLKMLGRWNSNKLN